MRRWTLFLFGFMLALRPGLLWADQVFYDINSDLSRVFKDKFTPDGFQLIQEDDQYRLPADFRLGQSDTVVLNLWGKVEANYEITVNRDGYLVIPMIGKVHVLGLTLNEARNEVRKAIEARYSNVDFDLDITDVRNIRVEILGYAQNPGIYAVRPYSYIIEALAQAGGPNALGSLSNIQLIRRGEEVANFSVYDYIIAGKHDEQLFLQQDDLIYVPPVVSVYALRGDVRHPGIYDQNGDSRLSRAVEMAGGLLPTTLKRKISIVRIDKETQQTKVVKEILLADSDAIGADEDVQLMNFDTVIIGTDLDFTPYMKRLFRQVSVSGEVDIPGRYRLKQGEMLSGLLKRVGVITETAFLKGAVFTRPDLAEREKEIWRRLIRAQERAILEDEARLGSVFFSEEERLRLQKSIENRKQALNLLKAHTPQGRMIIDLAKIMAGQTDILLQNGDQIFIPPVPDWVLVTGAVINPQAAAFVPNQSMEYYLELVGGPTGRADNGALHVIKPDGSTESKSTGFSRIGRGDIIIVPEEME